MEDIIVYENGELELKVSVNSETVWLNRQQLSSLFDRDVKTIGKHIDNVFKEKELDKSLSVANFATVQNEGGRKISRDIDYSILTLFSKYPKIKFKIITSHIPKQLKLDINKYNSQYNNLEIIINKIYHDRFIIVDDKELYHIGASLKDLGKKVFAFNKMDIKSLVE